MDLQREAFPANPGNKIQTYIMYFVYLFFNVADKGLLWRGDGRFKIVGFKMNFSKKIFNDLKLIQEKIQSENSHFSKIKNHINYMI